MLITRRHGSWVVLGTLVTDRRARADAAARRSTAASCTLCIDACPTGALDEPGTLDATRCLSYWTQAPAPIPEAYRAELGAQVYGCDICQDVCPWNRGDREAARRRAAAGRTRAARLARRVAAGGRRRARARYDRLYVPAQRRALPAAQRARRARERRRRGDGRRWPSATPTSDDELLREHARWALARIGTRAC